MGKSDLCLPAAKPRPCGLIDLQHQHRSEAAPRPNLLCTSHVPFALFLNSEEPVLVLNPSPQQFRKQSKLQGLSLS